MVNVDGYIGPGTDIHKVRVDGLIDYFYYDKEEEKEIKKVGRNHLHNISFSVIHFRDESVVATSDLHCGLIALHLADSIERPH